MKRAVGFSRKSAAVRRVEIWNSVGKHTAKKGFASLTDIAKDLRMTRSSHLRDMVFELVTSDKIDMRLFRLLDGRQSYQFYFSFDRLAHLVLACDLPWKCSPARRELHVSGCTVFDNGRRRVCPVSLMGHDYIESLKSRRSTLTDEEQANIDKYHGPNSHGLKCQGVFNPSIKH